MHATTGRLLRLLLSVLLAFGACTSSTIIDGTQSDRAEFQLVVTSDVSVSSVHYSILGNGYSKTGSIDVDGDDKTFDTTISGIPEGNGYKIVLTATADDGSNGLGSATFNVTARTGTVVKVVLRFTLTAPKTGSIAVNGTVNSCPYVKALTASNLVIPVGGAATFTAEAADPDDQPSPPKYTWTVSPNSVGSLSSTSVANPTFTAVSAGTALVTASVSDGDDGCQNETQGSRTFSAEVIVTSGEAAGASSLADNSI